MTIYIKNSIIARNKSHSCATEAEMEKMLLTLPSLTATAALKRKQVGVVAITSQAEIRPPDGIPLPCMKNKLSLGELHDSRAQLIALIIHIGDLGQREETQ